jgi:hypothetical protein
MPLFRGDISDYSEDFMNIEIVTSCINCVAPGNLAATLAVVVLAASIAAAAERRKRQADVKP